MGKEAWANLFCWKGSGQRVRPGQVHSPGSSLGWHEGKLLAKDAEDIWSHVNRFLCCTSSMHFLKMYF